MKQSCHCSRQHTCKGGYHNRRHRVHMKIQNHNRTDASAQRKASVHGQIRNIKKLVRNVNAQNHDSPQHSLGRRAQKGRK